MSDSLKKSLSQNLTRKAGPILLYLSLNLSVKHRSPLFKEDEGEDEIYFIAHRASAKRGQRK